MLTHSGGFLTILVLINDWLVDFSLVLGVKIIVRQRGLFELNDALKAGDLKRIDLVVHSKDGKNYPQLIFEQKVVNGCQNSRQKPNEEARDKTIDFWLNIMTVRKVGERVDLKPHQLFPSKVIKKSWCFDNHYPIGDEVDMVFY